MSTPHAAEPGGLTKDTVLRGDFAGMFGRTVRDVQQQLVGWQIPGSREVLAVHSRIVPALDLASTHLNEEMANGHRYRIDSPTTFSTAARTIKGTLRISRHTFGIAFDVNTRRNPFRSSNELVTDLPNWWVKSFLDAGFCWGGLWIGSKDAMHIAWQGPAFSGFSELPLPYEPLTEATLFANPAASVLVIPEPTGRSILTSLVDTDSNGAVDVVRVVGHGPDLLVESSVASRRHNACSLRTTIVPGLATLARSAHTVGFGDLDGRGGQDLWIATNDGGRIRLTVRWAFGGFTAETSVVTAVPTPEESAWIGTADYDTDGDVDLYVATKSNISVWSVDPSNGVTSELWSGPNPHEAVDHYFLGDLDLDNRPDLWAISSGHVTTSLAAGQYSQVTSGGRPLGLPSGIEDVRAADYDGDGRVDLITFDGISKQVWLGNTPLPDDLPLEGWFEYAEPECAEDERTWDRQDLRFVTSTWIAHGAHDWRMRNDLPVGCDPEDETCRVAPVTRQMFAEFLAWVDGLTAPSGDPDQVAAWAVSAAGYAFPCVPTDSSCLAERMSGPVLSSYFGMFLSQRRGGMSQPHRWTAIPATMGTPDRMPR